MFLPSCASLAADQPTLRSLIQRVDDALAGMGPHGDVVAADLAYTLGEDPGRITTILEELVGLGGLTGEDRIFCENRCLAITPSEFEEALREGSPVRCSRCGTRLRDRPETVYRIREDACHASVTNSNIPDGQALQGSRTHKMIFAAANPDVQRPLALDVEWNRIERRFSRKECRVEIERIDLWATTIGQLRQAMLDHRPTIVHFSGHGTTTGGLVFASDANEPRRISTQALGELFGLCSFVECVFLNACFSAQEGEAIAKHIHCVVAMHGEIGDESAIEFATAFYEAVTAGEPLGRCFQIGKNALRLADLTDVDHPTVWIDGINYPSERGADTPGS